jgi:TolA-binding protein
MPARLLFAFLICTLLFTTSQSTAQSTARSLAQTAAPASDSSEDIVAMKSDLAKMRVLVTQMQNNLGLTTTSTTPLYHQFELETQMWQLLIAQMERRIERLERNPSPGRNK